MINNSSSENPLPKYLDNLQKSLFEPFKLNIKNVRIENESSDYNACIFEVNRRNIIFRTAKITPKKIGKFVTLWKRNMRGPIEPFNLNDPIDLYVIEVLDKNKIGYFLFNKQILNEHGVLSGNYEGKRGFRIYPSWDHPINKQGLATQNWQLPFFIETTSKINNVGLISKHLNLFLK